MSDDTQETMTVDEAIEHARNIATDCDFDRNAERGEPAHFENVDRDALKLLANAFERLRVYRNERDQLRAKLRRFEEREVLVRELLERIQRMIPVARDWWALELPARAVRDFALEPAAVSDAPAPKFVAQWERPAGCACTHESGDSDCAMHPTCPGCGEALDETRLAAERDRFRTELERRNVAHVEPAITAKDRDDWKARAVAAERERDVAMKAQEAAELRVVELREEARLLSAQNSMLELRLKRVQEALACDPVTGE